MEMVKRNGHPTPLPEMPARPVEQLTIILNPDGSVGVNGPIGNKMLCYGMMEAARDAIKDYRPSPIIPV